MKPGAGTRQRNNRTLERALHARLLRTLFPSGTGTPAAVRNLKQVAIFPHLGIAFNRLQKNGSSTVMSFLYFAEYGQHVSSLEAKGSAIHLDSLGTRGILALGRRKRIAIVRDPFSRTLSAFLQKFRSPRFQSRFGSFDLSPEGFSAFLEFLSAGGLRANSHWSPQTDRLLLAPHHYHLLVPFSEFPNKFLDTVEQWTPGLRQKFADFSQNDIQGPQQTEAGKRVGAFYNKTDLARVEELYCQDLEVPEILSEAEKIRAQMRISDGR